MRTRTEGDYIFTYPDARTPIFGSDIYVMVENTGTPIANGTEAALTINGAEYKSVWMNNYIYFYFDVKLVQISFSSDMIMSAVFEDVTLNWILGIGAWENRGMRNVDKVRATKKGLIDSVSIEEGNRLCIKYTDIVGSSIYGSLQGETYVNISITTTNATYFGYIIQKTSSPFPSVGDVRWTPIQMDSLCSRFKIVEQKEKFTWIDRNGYTHTYYFDVNEMSEGHGDSTEYVKTRLNGTNTIHYKTSLSVPKIKKGYISNYENKEFLKDLITLGSCLYLEVNDIPIDPKNISGLGVGASKGLEVLTFSIDYEIMNKNTIIW